jgi:hypothetical protein
MAVPTLLCVSEIYTKKNKNANNTQAAEIIYIRTVKRLTKLDKIKSEDIWNKLNIYLVNNKVDYCRVKWLQFLNRTGMNSPKLTFKYKPKGYGDIKVDHLRKCYKVRKGMSLNHEEELWQKSPLCLSSLSMFKKGVSDYKGRYCQVQGHNAGLILMVSVFLVLLQNQCDIQEIML